jgi:hypothetical protein
MLGGFYTNLKINEGHFKNVFQLLDEWLPALFEQLKDQFFYDLDVY